MTPKEKAKELVYKYSHLVTSWDCYWDTEIPIENRMEQMKECALIAVDLVINQWEYIDTSLADGKGELNPNLKYWYEVKQEIQKL